MSNFNWQEKHFFYTTSIYFNICLLYQLVDFRIYVLFLPENIYPMLILLLCYILNVQNLYNNYFIYISDYSELKKEKISKLLIDIIKYLIIYILIFDFVYTILMNIYIIIQN